MLSTLNSASDFFQKCVQVNHGFCARAVPKVIVSPMLKEECRTEICEGARS